MALQEKAMFHAITKNHVIESYVSALDFSCLLLF
jgi:hypothetical protein